MTNYNVGAPTKFTVDVKKKLITAIQKGATYELACNYARISYGSFRSWMKLGEEQIDLNNGDEYLEFFKDVKEAEGLSALVWLKKIDDGAVKNWQAAAWKLERKYPKQYGRMYQDIPKDTPIDELSEDDLDARISEILNNKKETGTASPADAKAETTEKMETIARATDKSN